MTVTKLQVEFCEKLAHVFNAHQIPQKGVILVPDGKSPGTWLAVLPSKAVVGAFREAVEGDDMNPWKGMPVVSFNAGANHRVSVLKTYLERCHFKPEWEKVPKFLNP